MGGLATRDDERPFFLGRSEIKEFIIINQSEWIVNYHWLNMSEFQDDWLILLTDFEYDKFINK